MKKAQKNTSGKRSYDYISRYASFPYYFNYRDKKYVYGITRNLNKNTPYVTVKVDFTTTLDELSNKYYGRPDYFWVIADFNSIQDPFITLCDHFDYIKIPTLSSISFGGE